MRLRKTVRTQCGLSMTASALIALATPVRKAYRKRALKTHPDRLPPQTSEADKAAASEAFRKVCEQEGLYQAAS